MESALAMIAYGDSIEKASKITGIPTDKILARMEAQKIKKPSQ
jgi:hypothetical protein